MNQKIIYAGEAREKIKQGVDGVANAVKITLGAKGRNVAIMMPTGAMDDRVSMYPTPMRMLRLTKDGVSVASSITYKDQCMDAGAQLIIEAAEKTRLESGDATTTTIVLAQKMIDKGFHLLEGGINPSELNKGISAAVKAITDNINLNSKTVNGNYDAIKEVATISANNDKELGSIVAEAFKNVGEDGVVIPERGKSNETKTIISKGYSIDNGFNTHLFSNNNKNQCILENARVLVTDLEISTDGEIDNILRAMANGTQSLSPFIIVCDKIELPALQHLVVNNTKGVLKCCVVLNSNIGPNRDVLMEDIAIATGGKYLCKEKACRLQDISFDDFGEVEKIVCDRKSTTFIGGTGESLAVDKRVKDITEHLEVAEDDFDISLDKNRIARFTGGSAVIQAGGVSATEISEIYDRLEDAVCAVYAALDGGIVPGAGMALVEAGKQLESITSESNDFLEGVNLVYSSTTSPAETILENAAYSKEVDVNALEYGKGINVLTENVEDLFKSGIVDPAKVVVSAIQNSASAAKSFITTGCIIIDEEIYG